MTLLIVNPMNDVHCRHMISLLQEKKISYIEVSSLSENDLAFYEDSLFYNGKSIMEQRIQGVYFRSVLQDPEEINITDEALQYNRKVQFSAQNEVVKAWLSILHDNRFPVINPPRNYAKFYQLYKLRNHGIPMPKTCVTSSVDVAHRFIMNNKSTVCKPLSGGSYCQRVTTSLLERIHLIENEPVIFQEEIVGEDVRVNMLDGIVLSSHIIKKSNKEILDYRTDPNYHGGNAEYEEVRLPEDVLTFCDKAMKLLGLTFSGIDLRKMKDGRYVLLECNSMPAFLDIELKTGAPITERIIDYLQSKPLVTPTITDKHITVSKKKQINQKGESLFDYYEVMKEWSERANSATNRIVIPLNEEQKQKLYLETGKINEYMEIEKKDDTLKIIGVW
ncbi:ATP-grasp domain-containing protein [Bacillus alkalicellulosilyticus]|uniref:ATP-grasp domain-containing protein n=1 Tax=Alkalihalobacterium alkalicellulosilyticum TaxID=1912214 RepID=UPI000996E970|nr:ATP-grasp domain-containing protein [Bacillus alkalicellulosilyticus]